MHYCGYIITDKIPTKEEISSILEPYNENNHDNLEFSWDWYQIGGRYGGMLKIHFNPNENEDNWYCGEHHERNYKYFISNKLDELKEKFSRLYWDELEIMLYMGLNDKVLYVDGAYYKDIYDFDITNCCFVIDNEKNLYSRESYKNGAFVTDCDFDEKVKKIMLEDKFITVIDMHD